MNERFFSLPTEKQQAIINAGYRVFSQNSYKNSPMSEIADAAGISVTKYKYAATCLGAGICGLGGVFYVMDYTKGTWANDGSIEKLGWLAVALVIFTRWKPKNAIWGSYLFGLMYWLYFYMAGLTRSSQELFKMLPYVVTIIVLILVSMRKKREDQPPQSLGMAYFREER